MPSHAHGHLYETGYTKFEKTIQVTIINKNLEVGNGYQKEFQ